MGHHVHGADTKHSAIHIVAVEHVVHVMILLLPVEEDLLLAVLLEVLARRNEEAGRAAGGIADDVIRFRVHQLHHHLNDMAGRAELAIEAGLRDLRKQVFIGVAANIGGLGLAHQLIDHVKRIDDLVEHQGRGDHKDRVVHIAGISAVLIAMQIFNEREHELLHDGIHLARRIVTEHRPFELTPVDLAIRHLHLLREDARKRQAEHRSLLCAEVIALIEVVNKHKIGYLFDDGKRVHYAACRKNIP